MQILTPSTTKKSDQVLLGMSEAKIAAAIHHLCKIDFLIFMRVELGLEIGPQHHLWAIDLATKKDVVELAPRDHGKSVSLSRAYVLWKIKYDPWCKEVLILGADQPSAVENLDKIKEILESRPSLRHLIPDAPRKDAFYARTEIKLSNNKTIRAKGIGSPLRGRHPQLIVLDDVLNEKNSLDSDNRAKIKRYFYEVVVPMKDKGLQKVRARGFNSQIVVVGTAQSKDDLYHDMIKNGEYVGQILRAIIDEEKKLVLWDERYSYEDLMATKRKIGSLAFSKEYQNNPISDETSLFPPSLFDALKDETLSYQVTYQGGHLLPFMGVDFSIPGSMDGDYTVIAVIGMNPTNEEFTLLNYYRDRPTTMQDQVYYIEMWAQMFNIKLGYLEDNMFQKLYANLFAKNTSLPLSGHTVTKYNKNSLELGILSFRPQFENAKWRFPYKTKEDKEKTDLLILEFAGLVQRNGKIGNEEFHDDIILALWHSMCAAREGATFSVSWD